MKTIRGAALVFGLSGCFRLTGYCASDSDCQGGAQCQLSTNECHVRDGGPAGDAAAPVGDLRGPQEFPSPADLAMPDLRQADLSPPGPLLAYLFPRPADPQQGLPIPVNATLATAPGARQVRYTLDTSDPRQAPLVNSPAALGLVPRAGNQVEVRWLAQEMATQGAADRYTLRVDPMAQRNMGVIVENLQLGTGPVAVVTPGAALQGSFEYLAWRSQPNGYCPGCIIQMVLLIDDKNVYCRDGVHALPSYTPQLPRLSDSFTAVAPQRPGEYPVYAGFTLEFTCADAMKKPASNATEIGRIIVR